MNIHTLTHNEHSAILAWLPYLLPPFTLFLMHFNHMPFLFLCAVCGISVPQPGIKLAIPIVEAWSLNHQTTELIPDRIRHSFILTDASLPRYLNFLSLSSGASKVGMLTGKSKAPVGKTVSKRFSGPSMWLLG